jgi:lysophospholipase L1-like esterase
MHRLLLTLLFLTSVACGSDRVAHPASAAGTGDGGSFPAGSSHQGGELSSGAGISNAGSASSQAGQGGATTGGGGSGGAVSGGASGGGGGASSESRWVGTWASAQQTTEMTNLPPAPGLAGNTLRQMVRASRGGAQLRLRLSNEFGTSAVTMSAVRVAVSQGGGAIDTATDTGLTFRGAPVVTIAAGAAVFSDAFDFALQPLESLAISIHFGSQTGDVTGHPGSRTTSFLQGGDAVSAPSLPNATKTEHWYFISGLDVMADAASGALVILGDSISDGKGSTTDQNNRWPDILAERLQAAPATSNIGVLNAAIGGNAVLSGGIGPPALDRFERDVLGQSGVRWLIVLAGVNDIGPSEGAAAAGDVIEAYQAFIAKAHQADVRAYGATILPVGGSIYAGGEGARAIVNDWIRTSGAFDAVIDLDAVVRDPATPTQLLSNYDSGDGLHPSPAGHRKLGESIDAALLSP